MRYIILIPLFVLSSALWASLAFGKGLTSPVAETTEPTIKPALFTAKTGRAPSADLKVKTSKVPTYDIYQKKLVKGKVEVYRVKSIPRLDIGVEPVFAASSEFNVQLPISRVPASFSTVKRATPPEPSIEKFLTKKPTPAAEAKSVVKINPNWQTPEVPTFAAVEPPVIEEVKVNLVKLEELSPVKLKFIQALIFLEIQKSYNMALALFAELINEKDVQTEATYQLALSSKGLGLYSEFKYQMMKVLNNSSPEWQKKSALSLAQNALPGDKELVGNLDPKIEQLKLEVTEADQYQMNRAKYYLDKNNLTVANAAMEEISPTSPLALDAQFLRSVLLYKGGHLQEAIAMQSDVLQTLTKNSPKSELKSISALTLARMYFQASKYKEAFDTYLKVDKSNTEWPQAMIEQAWSQILVEDYEGAAGNMFSLHTDFFKNTFAPESYVIRTVSYLNLCQYGDGTKVINDFKRKYANVYHQMSQYSNKRTSDMAYYETVRNFIKNPDQKIVEGLPSNFIFELVRHPSFINEQNLINSAEEQISKYNRITLDLIKKEKNIMNSQNDVRQKISDIRKKIDRADESGKVSLREDLAFQDKRLMSYKIQQHIAKKARNSIKELRINGLARIDKEKTIFKGKAASAIKNRFQTMFSTLKNTLDQSEVLNYELYAGAGEHIRYQTAGGEISDKAHAELKPEDQKALKWEFHGEVWQDELGHYRSSLKNVCPRESISQVEVEK